MKLLWLEYETNSAENKHTNCNHLASHNQETELVMPYCHLVIEAAVLNTFTGVNTTHF